MPLGQGLGRRHVDYALVETALLWALAQGLLQTFTPAVKAAWNADYRMPAAVMQEK